MSKRVKGLIVDELRSRYAELNSAVWVEFVGCDGNTNNEFRRELRSKELRLEIVKNALFRQAVVDGPLRALGDSLDGPAAIVTGGESAIDAAKVIDEWLSKIGGMKLRGAVLEGEYLDEARVAGLAKMPTKLDMQARIAGIIRSPGANIAAAVLAGGGNVAACIKTLIGKLEDGEEIRKSA